MSSNYDADAISFSQLPHRGLKPPSRGSLEPLRSVLKQLGSGELRAKTINCPRLDQALLCHRYLNSTTSVCTVTVKTWRSRTTKAR